MTSAKTVVRTVLITSLTYIIMFLESIVMSVAISTLSQVFSADITALRWMPDVYIITLTGL